MRRTFKKQKRYSMGVIDRGDTKIYTHKYHYSIEEDEDKEGV